MYIPDLNSYFIHIPKCGGTSVELFFWEMHGVKPHGGEIWIAVENDEPQIFEVTWEDIQEYGEEFLGMVKEYHKLYPLPENI